MEYVSHNCNIVEKPSDIVRNNERGLHSHLAAKLRENSIARLSKYTYVYIYYTLFVVISMQCKI